MLPIPISLHYTQDVYTSNSLKLRARERNEFQVKITCDFNEKKEEKKKTEHSRQQGNHILKTKRLKEPMGCS